MDTIEVRGARTHNLKNIDLDIPRDKLVVITGLSGQASHRLPSIRFTLRGSGATWSHSLPTHGNSCR